MKTNTSGVAFVFFLGLLISPFVYFNNAKIPFEIPKVSFVLRWIEILGILAIFSLASVKKRVSIKTLGLTLAFFFITFISSLQGADFVKSFWGNYYRGDGLFTLTHMIALSIILSIYWDESWEKPFIKTVATTCVLLGFWGFLWAILQNFFQISSIPNWGGAFGVSFGNPNLLSGFLGISLPFTYRSIKLSKHKNVWILGILMHIAGIILTFSWSGLLMILIFLVFLGLTREKSTSSWKIFTTLATMFILVAITAYLINYARLIRQWRFLPDDRLRIATKAYLAFKNKPLLGWGWANFDYAFESVDWPIKFQNDVYVDKAHSHLLEILVSSGVVGLAAYLTILIFIFIRLTKVNSLNYKCFLLTFILFIIHSQTNVISISEELIFWIIVGFSS